MKKMPFWLLSILLLSSCTGGTAAQKSASPAPSAATDPSPVVTTWEPIWGPQVFELNTTDPDTGIVVITVRYSLPDITNPGAPEPYSALREYYDEKGKELQNTARDLASAAHEDFDFARENGYDFYPYTDEQDYELKLDTEQYVSVLRTHYSYLGGAHGEVCFFSDTFDMTTGELMTLDQIFTVSSDVYMPRILTEIKDTQRLTNDETPVFDETALEDAFDPDCFYLTPDTLVIYYQVYSLGSHALGAPEFSIPREALEDILISW